MSQLQYACFVCKSTQYPRGGDAPWSQKCIDRDACDRRCVAGAYTAQIVAGQEPSKAEEP